MIKIIKICLWALAFIPLMVDNSVFSPYITGESLFLRGILVLTSILFLSYFFYKKKFRDGIAQKIKLFIKNPLIVSILVFIFLSIISTIFAVDKYGAFWGTIERAEGLVGILFFFSFFVYSLLIFEKKDWLWFFRLTLLVSLVVLFKEFIEFFSGIGRPGSFFGNPTFLAGYLLFSIFCAIVVFSIERNKFFKVFSIVIFILSILGIFIAETRGTILGLAVGFVAVLIYCIFKKQGDFLPEGKGISLFFKLNLRKISIIILCFLVVFSTVFISTRKNEIWQKVPGFSRVSVISNEDATTQTRLLTAKLSIESINPLQNGLKKFLIGWGPENFSLAYGKYFNPEQFNYEASWFDRAHNKLLDVLVMNGLLGLVAYLIIWFFFFKNIFKKKDFSLLNIGLLLFGISLFVHLLFVFDQPITYISFFAVLAFMAYLLIDGNANQNQEKQKQTYEVTNTSKIITGIFFSALALFLTFVFFRNDLLGYMQMKKYSSLVKNNNTEIALSTINSVFEPFTTAQTDIRMDLLAYFTKKYNTNNKFIVGLFNITILKSEEYIDKRPTDLRFLVYLTDVYRSVGKDLNDSEFILQGEKYLRRMIAVSPNRPDFNYGLALNLFYQKQYEESFNYFEKVFKNAPSSFSQDGKTVEGIYIIFIQYFYQIKDKENFIKTANRLKENNYIGSATLDQIIQYIEKNNKWPVVDFEPA